MLKHIRQRSTLLSAVHVILTKFETPWQSILLVVILTGIVRVRLSQLRMKHDETTAGVTASLIVRRSRAPSPKEASKHRAFPGQHKASSNMFKALHKILA